jgi:hypothetical protein
MANAEIVHVRILAARQKSKLTGDSNRYEI